MRLSSSWNGETMSVIKAIFHDKYGNKECLIPKSKQPKEYKLENITKPEVYSVDCLFQYSKRRGRHCDEFVFFDLSRNKTGLYLIERKKNSQDIKKVRQQLKGGANFIEAFLDGDPATDGQPFDFMPVWISKIRPAQRSILKKGAKISLKGRKKLIRQVKKGEALPSFTERAASANWRRTSGD